MREDERNNNWFAIDQNPSRFRWKGKEESSNFSLTKGVEGLSCESAMERRV